jgi:NAD(P)-dependent dehydrogenase (short-subunit alcohol dehydrogenase family)
MPPAMQRHIFITGTSSGLGLALAEACLERGDRVYGISRREPSSLLTHPEFRFLAVDLADLDAIETKIPTLLGEAPRLDLVVLNAGVLGPVRDLGETPLAEIRQVMDINTWANKNIIDALSTLGIVVEQVVGISSGAAVSGSRGWNAYALSKATFLMLLELYAQELPKTHFCSFAPGLVDTKMQDFLCSLPEATRDKFTTLKSIQAARGTEAMPTPRAIAPTLLARFEQARTQPSGTFIDIRQI